MYIVSFDGLIYALRCDHLPVIKISQHNLVNTTNVCIVVEDTSAEMINVGEERSEQSKILSLGNGRLKVRAFGNIVSFIK